MSMVCGLDLHRAQMTFDALEVETGEVWRGRIWSPDRDRFRRRLSEEMPYLEEHGKRVATVKRWVAAGMINAERGFRRVRGCKEMPKLVAALHHHVDAVTSKCDDQDVA